MKRIFILLAMSLLSLCFFTNASYAKGLTPEKFTEIVEKYDFKINDEEISEDKKTQLKILGVISHMTATKGTVHSGKEDKSSFSNIQYFECEYEDQAIILYKRLRDNTNYKFGIDSLTDDMMKSAFCQEIHQNGNRVCRLINPFAYKYNAYMVTFIKQNQTTVVQYTVFLYGITALNTSQEELQKRQEMKEMINVMKDIKNTK